LAEDGGAQRAEAAAFVEVGEDGDDRLAAPEPFP
jgi:hypothetical protein